VKNRKILIVAAHPDDEILGCGATVSRLVKDGSEAYTLILGEGVTSRDNQRNRESRVKEIQELKSQIEKANEWIGVKEVFSFDFPDNRFDSVDLLNIIKKIAAVKDQVKPDIIFTHYEGDLNIDHQLTFRAVLTATRPFQEETVKEIYVFETLSSTEWRFPLSFSPDTFFDITSTIIDKMNAMKEYKTELREYPHPRSLRGIELQAEYWGMRSGIKKAEAFKTIRKII